MTSECGVCGVCCNKYNKTRTPITCFKCSFEACNVCVKTYILGSVNDAQCMKCREIWSAEIIDETFSKHWRQTVYRKHRAQVLYDREKSMFPATIEAVQIEKRRRELLQKQEVLKDKLAKLRKKLTELEYELQDLGNVKSSKTPKEKIVCKCPKEDCRGFVFQHTKSCAICETKVCVGCFQSVIERDTHECNPEEKATADLIKRECRACPSCAVPIHRWTGCPMMWCTNCNTAFDWNTLEKIENKNIHNPHYIEYLERNQTGRNVLDRMCDQNQMPSMNHVNTHLRSVGIAPQPRTVIQEKHRILLHVEDIEMPRYRVTARDQDNEDLRVCYLIGDYDETTLKKNLLDREVKLEKKRVVYNILEMAIEASKDIFRRMLSEETKTKTLDVASELDVLYMYVQECFERETKRFGTLRKPELGLWPM